MTIFAMILLITAGAAGVIIASDDSSAVATPFVEITDDRIATEKTTVAKISFKETDDTFSKVEWNATLTNSSGAKQSSALSKSTGSTTKADDSWEVTITAPKTADTYTLTVVFKETLNGVTEKKEFTSEATLYVAEPITLSVTVSNKGGLALKDAPVYFYVDGNKIEDSKTTLTVEKDGSATLTYKYFDKALSSGKHTYYVAPTDGAYIEGLDAEHSYDFYYKQSTQDYMTIIMGIIVVILLIAVIMVFRKPVKNYGKPKARR